MIRSLRVIRAAAELEIRHLAVNLFMLFCALVQPFFIAVTVMFMVRHRPDFDPIYVVIGSGLSGLWSVALFDGNWAIGGERQRGTLELLVGAPAPLMITVAGKLAGGMLFSLTSMLASYAIGAWLFGYELGIREPLAFAASLVLAVASLGAMGLLFAPLGILARFISQFLSVMEYPVFIFGGFLFPILLLPGWTHPISYALPPYWAAVALHGTSSGELAGTELLAAWTVLTLSTIAVVLIARAFFRVVLVRARGDGTLALS